MDTIGKLLSSADKQTLAAAKLIDPTYKALPEVDRSARGSAGEIIAGIMLNKHHARSARDVLTAVKSAKANILNKFTDADAMIKQAADRAQGLHDAVAYLKGDLHHPPQALGEALATALLNVRSARAINPNACATLDSELAHAAATAGARVEHHKQLTARRRASAKLGITRQARAHVDRNLKNLPQAEQGTMAVWVRKSASLEKRLAVQYNVLRGIGRGGAST